MSRRSSWTRRYCTPSSTSSAPTSASSSFAGALPSRARVSEPILPLLLAALHEELGRPLVCLLPDDADARDAAEAAGWFLGAQHVALLPSRGVSWGSGLEPPPHLVGERARALDVLAARRARLRLRGSRWRKACRRRTPAPRPLRSAIGDEPGFDELAEQLALAGYERVERVEERGHFAVRGGLIDVFPSTGREPLRIELFGDEIEGVRAFSPFTQRALRPVEEAPIYPAAERRLDLIEPTLDDDGRRPLPDDLVPPLPGAPDLVWEPREVQRVWTEELERDELSLRRRDRARAAARGASRSPSRPSGPQSRPEGSPRRRTSCRASSAPATASSSPSRTAARRSARRTCCAGSTRGCSSRQDELPREPELLFGIAPARRGFVWRELGLVLLPDSQVFRKRPPRAPAHLGRALQSFADLRTGDYIVHEDHGVGKLLGFETRTVAEVTRDYLQLAFKGDDRLYVPHEQIGKVSRYIGADARAPALSKLGGRAWQLIKSRARASVHELAGELLALYARRQSAPGVTFDLSSDWLERLEAEFPYRETEDQQRAIEAVKADLEAPHPMDRLVCGDVGFGKTEVAIRAAFAAALNGKQTLMLVPTTVLAQQHWNTFRERFREFPVRVEMISRLRPPAQQKQALADFAEGKVDILVGTHRLLSRDVIPKNLGLVMLDEEQRFGVAQKELLRSLRLEVDVLALSATPIPRTLHMSLSGLRDISVIETPPEGRRAIRTSVGEYDEELIKAALEREHAREGQSFYLHNRVETIEEAALKLQQLCPGLRFAVAHGQMRERELEDKMLSFLRGDADVLVSTTIIESGLDIPQANTLIIERADLLGLAQLYQIRGRVGRSDVLAHAYLFYPDSRELTPEARARLSTIADHTELGAGFAIAMRDLEIRGAGELLGAEQSGHVAAVGFELYVELLAEAVAELSGQRRPAARPIRVDAKVDAYVPASYIPAEALKIDLHRRISLAETEDELVELHAATEDRYGPIPEPVENLFSIQEAKLKLARIGADYLVFRNGRATVGPLVLGSQELGDLRRRVDTAVYTTAKREVSLREEDDESDGFRGALSLVDAILESRQAA